MVGTIFFPIFGHFNWDNDNNWPICNASSEENGHFNQGPWLETWCSVKKIYRFNFSRLSHQIAAPLLWRSHFTTYNILNLRKPLSFSLVKKKQQIAEKSCIYSKMFFFFLKPASNIVRTITAVFHAD